MLRGGESTEIYDGVDHPVDGAANGSVKVPVRDPVKSLAKDPAKDPARDVAKEPAKEPLKEPERNPVVIYRIGVERLVQGELKIVRAVGKAKIINKDSHSMVIDVATTGALFLEVFGTGGLAFGWYEVLFAL